MRVNAKIGLTAACLSIPFLSSQCFSQENQTFEAFRSGNWRGSVHFSKSNERFSHCTMNASYKSGISVFFAIDNEFKWRIGFSSEKWNLKVGHNYNIAYVVDNYPVNWTSARAVSDEFVIAELPATSQVFQQFRAGHQLIVKEGDNLLRFSLNGTARALSSLLECANEGKLRTASDFRAPGTSQQALTPPARQPSPSIVSAEEKLEATQVVANILSTGELRDYKLMTSSEVSNPSTPEIVRTAAVAWKASSSIGVLHIIPNSAANIDTLVAGVIGGDAEACKGTFASGKIPDAEMTSIRRVFTTCQTDGKSSNHIEYIFVPRQNGSTYRFGTATFLSGDAPKKENSSLREAIKKAVFDN